MVNVLVNFMNLMVNDIYLFLIRTNIYHLPQTLDTEWLNTTILPLKSYTFWKQSNKLYVLFTNK